MYISKLIVKSPIYAETIFKIHTALKKCKQDTMPTAVETESCWHLAATTSYNTHVLKKKNFIKPHYNNSLNTQHSGRLPEKT